MQLLETYKNKQNISQDNDDPTDLYEGLNAAIRTLSSDETNIIVLIGDAGNSTMDKQRIINELKQNECGLISFQTRSVSGQIGRIYNDFVSQTKALIKQSSGRPGFSEPKFYEDQNNTYRLRYPIESNLPGSLTYSDKGGAMSQAELEEEIRTMLTAFEKQHEQLLRDLDCKIYIDCKPGTNDAVLDYILKENPNIDEATLRQIRDMDYQLFVEAYAPLYIDKLDDPIFKHVIFLTRQEFNELEKNLEKLLDVSETPSKLREEIITSYKQILIGYYGSDARKEIADKTPAEVLEIVTGLPSASPLLTKYTIADIEDKRKVSDSEIQEIFYYMDEKLADMKRILGNPDYFFRSRNETYYWVPQEVLP